MKEGQKHYNMKVSDKQQVNIRKGFSPFLDENESKKVLSSAFKKLTGTNYTTEEELITIGYVKPIEIPLFVVRFMEEWVSYIDNKLAQFDNYTNEYSDWYSIRGFTYDEFRFVMETAISEEKIKRKREYDYLYLDDSIAVEEFKIKYSDPEISIRYQFLKALEDTLSVEVPFLHDFLCQSEIALKHPIKNFYRHCYLLAQSSSGKTEYIKHLIFQIIGLSYQKRNKSIVLIEPHKDLSIDILRMICHKEGEMDRLIYLDPNFASTCEEIFGRQVLRNKVVFSINPFDIDVSNLNEVEFMTQHISAAFFDLIDSEESHQMQSVIEACVQALILRPNSSILDLKRFMNDSENSDLVTFSTSNLSGEKLELMKNRFLSDPKLKATKSSLYYRLQSLLGKDQLVQSLTGTATVNVREAINSGKILICNFNQSSYGPDGARLMGKLMNSLISGYAVLRQKLKREDRVPTFFFMDEFQNYIHPGTTEQLFAEARKYTTYMVVANQQVGQEMSSEIKKIISGNTAIKYMGENEPSSIAWMTSQMKGLRDDANYELPEYSFYMYDKFKKDLGSFILRSPSYLVDTNSRYYMNDRELIKLIYYLARQSGIYRDSQEPAKTIETPNQPIVFDHNFSE